MLNLKDGFIPFKEEKKRLNIELPMDLYKKCKGISNHLGFSFTAFIILALRDYIRRYE